MSAIIKKGKMKVNNIATLLIIRMKCLKASIVAAISWISFLEKIT